MATAASNFLIMITNLSGLFASVDASTMGFASRLLPMPASEYLKQQVNETATVGIECDIAIGRSAASRMRIDDRSPERQCAIGLDCDIEVARRDDLGIDERSNAQGIVNGCASRAVHALDLVVNIDAMEREIGSGAAGRGTERFELLAV